MEEEEEITPLDKRASSYAQDYFYCPEELQGFCLWQYSALCKSKVIEVLQEILLSVLVRKSSIHLQQCYASVCIEYSSALRFCISTQRSRRNRREIWGGNADPFKSWTDENDAPLKELAPSWSRSLRLFLPSCPHPLLLI